MSRCMCGHHANGSRPAAWCERRDMRDGDLALSGEDCADDATESLAGGALLGPGLCGRRGSGGWRIEEWSECPQDREEMGKDDRLQAVGVPARGRFGEEMIYTATRLSQSTAISVTSRHIMTAVRVPRGRRRVVASRPQRDGAGKSRGADRRNGEEGVRRPYEGPDWDAPDTTRRSPTTSTIGRAWVLTTPHVHAAGWSDVI